MVNTLVLSVFERTRELGHAAGDRDDPAPGAPDDPARERDHGADRRRARARARRVPRRRWSPRRCRTTTSPLSLPVGDAGGLHARRGPRRASARRSLPARRASRLTCPRRAPLRVVMTATTPRPDLHPAADAAGWGPGAHHPPLLDRPRADRAARPRRQRRAAAAGHLARRPRRQHARPARPPRASRRGRSRGSAAAVTGALALVFGVLGIAAGVEGFHYTRARSAPSGDDFTGLLCLPAGLLLIGLGVVTLWRTRRTDGGLAWRSRAASLLGVAGRRRRAASWSPPASATSPRTSGRAVVPPDHLGVAYEDVSFKTGDGLELEGWYIPSRNGAAVIAFPGRNGPQKPGADARPPRLRRAALRPPRRGPQRRRPNSWGWGGDAGRQGRDRLPPAPPDVDPDRIGGIGLSVGGEMMIETAAETHDLAAVVSEGAGARSSRRTSISDEPASTGSLGAAIAMKTAVGRDVVQPAAAADLEDLAAASAQPLLLIAAPEQPERRGAQPRLRGGGARQARCGRSRSPATSAASRRGRRSTSGASSASSTRRSDERRGDGGLHGRRRRRPGARRSTTRSCTAVPGLGLGQHALAGLIALVAGTAAIVAFPAAAAGARAALAFALGALALVNGAMHVLHVGSHGASGGDVTGVLAARRRRRPDRARRRDPLAPSRRGHRWRGAHGRRRRRRPR